MDLTARKLNIHFANAPAVDRARMLAAVDGDRRTLLDYRKVLREYDAGGTFFPWPPLSLQEAADLINRHFSELGPVIQALMLRRFYIRRPGSQMVNFEKELMLSHFRVNR